MTHAPQHAALRFSALHAPRSRSRLEIRRVNLPEGSGHSTSEGVSADMGVLTSGTQIHNLKEPAAVSGEAKGKGIASIKRY